MEISKRKLKQIVKFSPRRLKKLLKLLEDSKTQQKHLVSIEMLLYLRTHKKPKVYFFDEAHSFMKSK